MDKCNHQKLVLNVGSKKIFRISMPIHKLGTNTLPNAKYVLVKTPSRYAVTELITIENMIDAVADCHPGKQMQHVPLSNGAQKINDVMLRTWQSSAQSRKGLSNAKAAKYVGLCARMPIMTITIFLWMWSFYVQSIIRNGISNLPNSEFLHDISAFAVIL